MKFERGYIDPSPIQMQRRQKIGDVTLSTKVTQEDKDKVAVLCSLLNTNPSEWLRELTMTELQKFNLEQLSSTNLVDQRFTSSITLTQKRFGLFGTIKAFVDFLETQKKPEFGVQASIAQQHRGY